MEPIKTFITLAIIAMIIPFLYWLSYGVNSTDAKVASRNIEKSAEMFEINRRVVFFNGITDTYMLSVEGLCSIDDQVNQLEVTCKTGKNTTKKHLLGLSDNVSYFVEQLNPSIVSKYHYRVIFKPESIVPDLDVAVSTKTTPSQQKTNSSTNSNIKW